jgi:hypothetical protein
MSPADVEEILYEEPFRAFRVTLASGDQYVVNNRQRALISGLSLVVGLNDDPKARTGTRLKIISIPNIVMAEHIDPRRPGNGRRRQR